MGAQENDKPVWIGSNNRRFNIKFANILDKKHRFNVPSTKCWNNIWKFRIHGCLKVFLWRVAPLKSKPFQFLTNIYSSCPLCNSGPDISVHLLFQC